MSGTYDFSQSSGRPARFKIEPAVAVKFEQPAVAHSRVKTDGILKFMQANRAQGKRPGVGFLQVIGAVHYASEVDAVSQRKHVGGFVDQHSGAAPHQQLLVSAAAWFAVKCRIIACKGEHADVIVQ